MNPGLLQPAGLPVPTPEDAPLVTSEAEDTKGVRIARTEAIVFEQHPCATHFRYPYVYGPYQLVPREWCVVRRIRDSRPFIVLPGRSPSLRLRREPGARGVARGRPFHGGRPSTTAATRRC
jgi:hypothetical protein